MRLLVAALLLAVSGTFAAADDSAPVLRFRLDEGRSINSFTRDGAVAAHLLLRSGQEPRILVAFPAGNSGVGLWFARADDPIEWTLEEAPHPVSLVDAHGRPLHGIEAIVLSPTLGDFNEDLVLATALRLDRAVLSSVRVLRDFEGLRSVPDEISTSPVLSGRRLVWARDRLDGAAEYRLAIEALGDAKVSTDAISSATPLRLKLSALTSEPPLTPVVESSLLTARATADARLRNVLAYLSYREKFLAGSWRFDTYFGRDTLMSLLLLAPFVVTLFCSSIK